MTRAKKSFPKLIVMLTVFLTVGGAITPGRGADLQALTLEDCLALAREKNPTLGAARERVNEMGRL